MPPLLAGMAIRLQPQFMKRYYRPFMKDRGRYPYFLQLLFSFFFFDFLLHFYSVFFAFSLMLVQQILHTTESIPRHGKRARLREDSSRAEEERLWKNENKRTIW